MYTSDQFALFAALTCLEFNFLRAAGLIRRYNGQGALGTGDEQDRWFPAQVPGLPTCMQVAAAASSMALSADGQVFIWGGVVGRRLQSAKAAAVQAAPSSTSGSGESSQGGDAGDAAAAGSAAQKASVPWLAGVRVVHITCGVDTAAAISSSHEVLFWGNKQCLPASMMGQAQALAGGQQEAPGAQSEAAAVEGAGTGHQQQDGKAGVAGQQPSNTQSTSAAAGQQAVRIQLLVQPSGRVKAAFSCAQQSCATAQASTQRTLQMNPAAVCATTQSPVAAPTQQQQQQLGINQQFDPQTEPVADLACGASHQVVLCQASQHMPSPGKQPVSHHLARPLHCRHPNLADGCGMSQADTLSPLCLTPAPWKHCCQALSSAAVLCIE